MTACKNFAKGGKAGRVITAALVATLSVGAPVVALATTGAEGGVDMLTAGDVTNFNNGTVWGAFVNGSATNNDSGALKNLKVTANGDAQNIQVTRVRMGNGVDLRVGAESGYFEDFKGSYVVADKDGKPTDQVVSEAVNPGNYCVKVEAVSGDYKGAVVYLPFTVEAANFTRLGVYEVNPDDADDVDDTKLVYTGGALNLGIEDDGVALEEGVDYSVKFLKAGSSIDASGVDVVEKGSYYAVVTGLGKYEGKSANLASFTVDAFDLGSTDGKVEVAVDPVVNSNALPKAASVKWTHADGTVTTLDPNCVKLSLSSGIFGPADEYEFTVATTEETPKNVVNSTTVDVKKYEAAATIQYDDKAWADTFTTDLSQDEPVYFDVNKIGALDPDGKDVAAGNVTITVTKADGNTVAYDSDWYKTAGKYTVRVVVGDDTDYKYGASAECEVTVTKGAVDADASAYVSYKGNVVTELTEDYTTSGIALSDFSYVVKTPKGDTLTKDVDYTVTVTDEDGEKVTDKMVDAGVYTITIEGKNVEISGTNTVKVTINPLKFDDVKLLALSKRYNFEYLSSAKVASVIFSDAENTYVGKNFTAADLLPQYKDGENEWTSVDAALVDYQLQKLDSETGEWKDVDYVAKKDDEVIKGDFRLVMSAANDDVAKNVIFADEDSTVITFEVLDNISFGDVLPTHWAFNEITAVSDVHIMNGYGEGSGIFGPDDLVYRDQFAQILYNAANWVQGNETTPGVTPDEGYETGFSDVDPYGWSAKAIAWAKNTGLAEGYPDGTFGAADAISREQYVVMLARYAQKMNDYTPVEDVDAVLATMKDGDKVSDWAKNEVAWAVERGLIGANNSTIDPQGTTNRAQAAIMLYRYFDMD